MSEISRWLEKHGLSKYAAAFAEHEIELGDLTELTDKDLTMIGLALGPRRRFMKAVRADAVGGTRPHNTALGPAIVAERRQLTVMFIDLVGSTEISQRVDPEDLAEVLRLFKETCAASVAAFDGHIASYYGDGIMVFFGFPHAHEDDPERAIRAGLRIIEEIPNIRTHAKLNVRVGIATGLVVVGDLRGEKMFEDGTAMGETPNLAARLQAMADPGTLIVAPSTHHLAGDAFEYVLRGAFNLKGFAKEVEAWQVTGARDTVSRFMALDDISLNPLVGRATEYETLTEKWKLASAGQGQVVLVSGEPGIGKSRLVEELRQNIPRVSHAQIRYQCSPYHYASAFYPVIRQIENAAGLRADEPDDVKLKKISSVMSDRSNHALKLAASLLSVPFEDQLGTLDLSPQQYMEQTLEMLLSNLASQAEEKPVLLLFEDAHWIDPTTKLLLDRIADRIRDLRVLVVMTFRPEFDLGWVLQSNLSKVVLKQLDFQQVKSIVDEVAKGQSIADEMYDTIAARSDGVPLYVEEVTKDLLETGNLTQGTAAYSLGGASPASSVPSTLHDALMARLDRLSSVKEIAQIGAVIGPQFSYPLIAKVARISDKALRAGLELLFDAGIVTVSEEENIETFSYRHALIRDTAYNSLLKSERRILHSRVAEVLNDKTSHIGDASPEILAHHYTMAGMGKEAIDHRYLAGQRAVQRSANIEANTQLSLAIEQLKELQHSIERDRKEIEVQVLRAGVLRSTAGIAADETGTVYARIRDLCERAEETEHLFPVLNGLYSFHLVRAEYDLARNVAAQLLDLADSTNETQHQMVAHRAMGAVLFHIGQLDLAYQHLNKALELYDRKRHGHLAYIFGSDHAAITSCFLSIAIWMRGAPDKALEVQKQAVAAARRLEHAHSIAQSLTYLCMLHLLRREPDQVLHVANQLEELSSKHSFKFMSLTAALWRSWVNAYVSPETRTIQSFREASEAWWASGAGNYKPFFLTLIAELSLKIGERDSALRSLADARKHQNLTNEGWAQAETDRVYAIATSEGGIVEAEFRKALDTARRQQAKMFELRTAVDFIRLCKKSGDVPVPTSDLINVLETVTGGEHTVDLIDARRFLAETAVDETSNVQNIVGKG
ncbi:Adenylate cyclase 1 [Ruegeria denitrificans]|uniref:Adenylate cyclase 1 n=1 Tax=Ruegeria denitrificans TaxID=1715692 RepID=A0A0P1IH74_9RHOB|nr:adenylate/guanylate cyclase domain-containing protein [Ruegeria denitrificans]CUK12613.1 Adenylate cyclase 1 [Ruegeria denitrificans]